MMDKARTLWGREPVILLALIPLLYEILSVLAVDAPVKEAALTMLVEGFLAVIARSQVTPSDPVLGVLPDLAAPEFRRDPAGPIGEDIDVKNWP